MREQTFKTGSQPVDGDPLVSHISHPVLCSYSALLPFPPPCDSVSVVLGQVEMYGSDKIL